MKRDRYAVYADYSRWRGTVVRLGAFRWCWRACWEAWRWCAAHPWGAAVVVPDGTPISEFTEGDPDTGRLESRTHTLK